MISARVFTFITIALLFAIGESAALTKEERLDALVRAYPQALSGHDENSIFWRDGTKMSVDDGIGKKSFRDLLVNSSILDQLSLPYPSSFDPPELNNDPGRFRNVAFFKKMYGDCKTNQISKNLTTVIWLPKSWGRPVQVTRLNGVADQLRKVSAEIDELAPEIRSAAFPIAGVLSCRPVADTGQMSMHGYAAAIDLNLKFSDYWLWARKSGPIPYKNRMPREIVEIFERHGFIWGGKWHHYDTMHFEYRPEFFIR